ncbi:hypothetical protein [Kitasatospora sp. HPMI-4]|uniref:hypothetical protein n=1 Tax=Kitasatospora sp. HPMI-4 TaxID=3448443 RepID=UPI003F1B0C21
MNRLNRVLAWTVGVAALSGGLTGCGDESLKQHRDVGYNVSGPVRTLVIMGETGDIRVTGGGGTAVAVTEHQAYRDVPPTTMHRVLDGTLVLDFSCPDGLCGVGYDVTVPAAAAVMALWTGPAARASTPASGSRPACDARPVTVTSKRCTRPGVCASGVAGGGVPGRQGRPGPRSAGVDTRSSLASQGTFVKRPVWWVPATAPERDWQGEPGWTPQ